MSKSPATDLQQVIQLGLARGAHLLSAGESTIVRRIGALRGEPAMVYARLTGRVGEIYDQDTLSLPGIRFGR